MPTTNRSFARKLILAKVETTSGSDPVPTAALNAIEARNVQFTPLDGAYVENDIEAPYYGALAEIATSQSAKLSFDIALQGSGAAGTAPAYGPLLRGCGLAEKILAAAHTGTAQAGGASTITLAASASAVDNAYQGMFLTLTGGTGSGQSGFVLAYNGTTKVATMVSAWTTQPTGTTTYSVGAQVAYVPVSTGMESVTLYAYFDGLLHKLIYGRGSVKASLTPKGLGKLSFDFTSLYTTPTDVALPGNPVLSGFRQPAPVNNLWTSGFALHGFAANLYDLSMDLGQKVIRRDDCIGIDDVQITDRQASGSVVIQAPLQAEKDYYTAARDAVLGPLAVTHGTTAGSRARFCLPAAQVKAPKLVDKNGIIGLGMDLRPVPVNGNDEIFFILD
jgi:energy-coupling factor transporter ATP-binding protein EcfA2